MVATMKLRPHLRAALSSFPSKSRFDKPRKGQKTREKIYDVVLTDAVGESERSSPSTSGQGSWDLPPVAVTARHSRKEQRPATVRKERHNGAMGHPAAVAIHEDVHDHPADQSEDDMLVQLVSTDNNEDEEGEGLVDEHEDSMSEGSENSDDEIDDSVVEDMRKLEESFKGISQKYRLINRIGEGMSSSHTSYSMH
jgi:hypothetical protein